jgi:long-chain acyl-CoA synthetase
MLNGSYLPVLIAEQAQKYGKKTAISYRNYDTNSWVPVSWNDLAKKVNYVSNALLELGVKVQENVAVFSQNMPECIYLDFGAYGVRAVTIPFYATSSEAQVKYMIDDAQVRFVFVGEQPQYDTAFRVHSMCPTMERLIIFDRKVKKAPNDELSIYFDEFLAMGSEHKQQAGVYNRAHSFQPTDIANILYTSGTTGNSKGVVLTHQMYRSAIAGHNILPLGEKDVVLNFLPFTHVFERAWSYLCLACGCRLAVNLRPQDVLQSMREVHPTCMCSVPRFWEKVYSAVCDKIDASNFVQRKLMKEALRIGKKYNVDYLCNQKEPPMSLKLQYGFYEKTVIALLKSTLGLERANFFPTAGAAVPPVIEEFVRSVGINMVVGYGLTETTATVTLDINTKKISIGSVGRPLGTYEMRIDEETSEILLKGPSITPGYYKKEAATAEAIDAEGWFHTGDAGYMKEGELYLTDRIKDLFKTSNGKYIAPQMIESKLVVDRYIDQIVIIADQRKFVSALIIPNYPLLEEYARKRGIEYNSREELCKNVRINDMVMTRIETLQQEFAHYEQIKKICLLPQPFSMERGELTNTLKVKRRVLAENYKKEIDAMYAE